MDSHSEGSDAKVSESEESSSSSSITTASNPLPDSATDQSRILTAIPAFASSPSLAPKKRTYEIVPNPVKWLPRSNKDYTERQLIGEGTYGAVTLGKDRDGQWVALKKIKKEKREGFPITAIREIKLLKTLKSLNSKNVVTLKDVVSSHNHGSGVEGDVFMVFEFLHHDLAGLLEAKVNMSAAQVKYYLYEILSGLDQCHRNKILHRDVKPANVLISNAGDVKLCDLGLARSEEGTRTYTPGDRIVTLWYRPPELLLRTSTYDTKVDMWSVGCVFGELLSRRVLFPGDRTEIDQLTRIFDVCGTPTEDNWPNWQRCAGNVPSLFLNPAPKKRILAERFKTASPAARDLLDKLLQLDPSKRPSADEALNHDYFWKELPAMMKKEAHPKYPKQFNEYSVKQQKRQAQAAPPQPPKSANPPRPPGTNLPRQPAVPGVRVPGAPRMNSNNPNSHVSNQHGNQQQSNQHSNQHSNQPHSSHSNNQPHHNHPNPHNPHSSHNNPHSSHSSNPHPNQHNHHNNNAHSNNPHGNPHNNNPHNNNPQGNHPQSNQSHPTHNRPERRDGGRPVGSQRREGPTQHAAGPGAPPPGPLSPASAAKRQRPGGVPSAEKQRPPAGNEGPRTDKKPKKHHKSNIPIDLLLESRLHAAGLEAERGGEASQPPAQAPQIPGGQTVSSERPDSGSEWESA